MIGMRLAIGIEQRIDRVVPAGATAAHLGERQVEAELEHEIVPARRAVVERPRELETLGAGSNRLVVPAGLGVDAAEAEAHGGIAGKVCLRALEGGDGRVEIVAAVS